MKYLIAIMGPSGSGKSYVIKKILMNKCKGFQPKLVAKQTTRQLRANELEAIARGEDVDVEHVDKITADLVYQTYGRRTGVFVDTLIKVINQGQIPVVVINDIMAMAKLKKECQKRDSEICVISIFLFRRIPVRKEYFAEARRRGNVDKGETEQRYDKAKTIYRIYIDYINLFDYVMLNTISYDDVRRWSPDTIIDKQIISIRDNVILKNRRPPLRKRRKLPVVFVISGNGASGKDELIEATLSLGKLYADVVPKFTSRDQHEDDGPELVCKNNRDPNTGTLVPNTEYSAFIKDKEENSDKYLSYYGNGGKYEYSIDLTLLRARLNAGRSQVIALSDVPTIKKLKKEFGDQIIPVFCNSQIDIKAYKGSSDDETIKAKANHFEQQRKDFFDNYLLYRHIIIYAESELGHESDARQEELIDQLFRLFRAYEEGIL